MQMCQWNKAYITITNKLNKKHALSNDEIDELLTIVENVEAFMNEVKYQIMKKS